ncbi:cystathionine gamma-lyase [Pleionea sediminis]|uniref:cystathionine gamma-lyase n=1 Tax=Pleionea sediminis TaxID=2569479 RepID=UPI0011850259|nr:cystathionine gamma-lyase [Pleionea sediminis]
MKKELKTSTKVVHAGTSTSNQGTSINSNPIFTSAFHLKGNIENASHQYARFHNPTWDALENAIGDIEGGKVLIFPSGMAAIAATFMALVSSGDRILLQADGYYATRAFTENYLKKFGVEIHAVKTCDLPEQDFSKYKLTFIESPSNPLLDVIDIRQLAKHIHRAGGLLAIDNTTMTPLGQNPLSLGADISVCSDTKALNGHSDVLFGHIATNDDDIFQEIELWRKLSGSIPGPMETWLVHRGFSSLDMRLERMVSNAEKIAQQLVDHPAIKSVRYPGLKTDPSFKIAQQQMNMMGFIISFDLETQKSAELFLSRLNLITEATSFGGMHTMVERRARWGTDNVSEGLIRLSVGCENSNDLISDIENALKDLK